MPIRVGWLAKPYVVIVQYAGDVTDEEYIEAGSNPAVLAELDVESRQFVHIINEVVGDDTTIPGVQALIRAPIAKHPKLGWVFTINVSHDPVWRMIVTIVSQTLNLRMRDVETHEQALAWCQQMDATVPPDTEIAIAWFANINWTEDAAL